MKYVAENGKVFENEISCVRYEKMLENEKDREKYIEQLKDTAFSLVDEIERLEKSLKDVKEEIKYAGIYEDKNGLKPNAMGFNLILSK